MWHQAHTCALLSSGAALLTLMLALSTAPPSPAMHPTPRPPRPPPPAATTKYWSRRAARFLSEVASAKRTTTNNTPRVVCTEIKFNGLAAQALRLVDAMALADLIGASLSVTRPRYWNYGCAPARTWDCYFQAQWLQQTQKPVNCGRARARARVADDCDRVDQCRELTTLSGGQLVRGACANISSRASDLLAAALWQRLDYPESLHTVRTVAGRIWHHNNETQTRIDALCEQAGLGPQGVKRYVGVHIRRGDKVKEVPIVPITRFIDAVDIVAPLDMPLFAASDDGATIQALRAMTERRVLALPDADKRVGHLQRSVNRIAAKHKSHLVDEILADIQALVQASWFIGTFSSNMGRLVHALRDQPPETSISLDDRWAPSVAFHTFRQPYCEWEGANKLYCSTIANAIN